MRASTLVVILWALCSVSAQCQEKTPKISLSLFGGMQRDALKWSIAGNLAGENPNIYSELKWQKLTAYGPDIQLDITLLDRWCIQLENASYHIVKGRATDTDYQGDNRTDINFSALLSSDKGNIRHEKILLGYHMLSKASWHLVFGLGYSIHQQALYLLDLNPQISNPTLNSTYTARWSGVLTSLRMNIKFGKYMNFSGAATYQQNRYIAHADWNLIEDFQHPVSFEHIAKGYRIDWSAQLSRKTGKNLSFHLTGCLQKSRTGAGLDYVYLNSGAVSSTKLNGVYHYGKGLQLGVTYTLL